MEKYYINPLTTQVEKVLVRESIPFIRKGNCAVIKDRKQFVRAAFNLLIPYLPTEFDFVNNSLS